MRTSCPQYSRLPSRPGYALVPDLPVKLQRRDTRSHDTLGSHSFLAVPDGTESRRWPRRKLHSEAPPMPQQPSSNTLPTDKRRHPASPELDEPLCPAAPAL